MITGLLRLGIRIRKWYLAQLKKDNQLCIISEDKKWRGEQCRFPLFGREPPNCSLKRRCDQIGGFDSIVLSWANWRGYFRSEI